MSDVRKFPNKGVRRDADDNITCIYQGYTSDEVDAKLVTVKSVMRGMALSMKIAADRGYSSLFDVPEAERFEIVAEAARQTDPANDERGSGK